jgi:hypothetical protein
MYEWTPPDVINNNIFCRASRFSCRQLEEPTKSEKKKQADEERCTNELTERMLVLE